MIKKRKVLQPQQNNNLSQNNKPVINNKEPIEIKPFSPDEKPNNGKSKFIREKEDTQEILKHQPKNIDPTLHKDFKTYHEEACYVLDLLESKGVNIYEEGRTGGMYLKQRGNAKLGHLFEKNNSDNDEINNNNKINSETLSLIFNKK